MPTPNDEQLYLEATQEVDNETPDPALWAKAMALAEGDEGKAKCRHITLRVEQGSKISEKTPPVDSLPSHQRRQTALILIRTVPVVCK